MRNKDFYKGIKLALSEKGWQKFIKIPRSEIIAYVYLMDFLGVKGRKTILRHFTPAQKKHFYQKRKASYSYILTFQLLQDLRRSKKVKDLFFRWHLRKSDYLKASKMLSGLLKQHANQKVKEGIQGASYALDVLDVLKFFTTPKLEVKHTLKILDLSVGRLATGIGLFLTPTTLAAPDTVPEHPNQIKPHVPNIPIPTTQPKPEAKPEAIPKAKPKPVATPSPEDLEKELDEEEEKEPKTNPKPGPLRPIPFNLGGIGGLLPLVALYFLLDSGKKKKK